MLDDRIILGKIYIGDNQNVIFTLYYENDIPVSEIYLTDGECQYQLLITDIDSIDKLNFNEHHQIYGTYRLRRGCEKTIYFTDNYNPPRYLNISDVNQFKVITQTSPMIQYGSVDAQKLRLQKVYDSIPKYYVTINENGQLQPGSYNISIRYVDEDLNPTEWTETSEPIIIFHDKLTDDFSDVRASSNDVDYRKYGHTNKGIRVEVDNTSLDNSYIFIQIALIGANSGTGYVNDVVYSPLLERDINNPDANIVYLFTGGTHEMAGTEDEILANTIVYDKVGWLEQADNRLVMANVEEMNIDWCKLQKYASRITADCIYKSSSAADISVPDNAKNPMVLFNKGVGYQPGEIYSFGIVYVFENGVRSPVYHIPGKNHNYSNAHTFAPSGVQNVIGMLAKNENQNVHDEQSNECSNIRYSQVAMSCEGFKYWGYDSYGDELSGELVRHHRFPYRNQLRQKIPLINDNSQRKLKLKYHYNLITGIGKGHYVKYKFKHNCETIYIKYYVKAPELGNMNNKSEEGEEYELNLDYKNKLGNGYGDVNFNAEQGYGHKIENHFIVSTDPNVIDGSNRKTTDGFNEIKKRKQYKYVDIFESYSYRVQFRKLQEIPQLIHNDIGGSFTLSSYITTGCTLTVKLNKKQKGETYGPIIGSFFLGLAPGSSALGGLGIYNYLKHANNNSEWLESLDEDYFVNENHNRKVVFDTNKRIKVSFDLPDLYNFNIYDGSSSDSDSTPDVINWDDSYPTGSSSECDNDEKTKPMNTVMGFRIEVKIEVEEQIDRKDLIEDYIFGIRFDSIEIPNSKYLNGHKIIGYYIVQNERTEEDKTILDSAVLTPVFEDMNPVNNVDSSKMMSQFRLFPTDEPVDEKFMETSNELFYKPSYRKSQNTNLVSDLLRKDVIGFINPEFKFHLKEYYNFTKIRIEGFYEQNEITDKDVYYDLYDNGIDKKTLTLQAGTHSSFYSTNIDDSWITQDVQAGTSYNKKINAKKDKDNDGFDLHIFHKHTDAKYKIAKDVTIIDIDPKNILYLRPLSFVEKEINNRTRSIYNASADNNAAFIILENQNIKSLFVTDQTKVNRLPYAYLIKDQSDCDYYPDFKDRPYYTASDFIPFSNITTTDSTIVFNGDSFISPMKYSTGMLYDIRMMKRGKKNTVWMYITGGLIIAGSLAGAAFTGGATLAAAGAGVALIQNGIKIDIAYKNAQKFSSKGGNKTINDSWIKTFADCAQLDDEIQWIFESVDGLFFESKVNMNWRCGATEYALTDYLDPLDGYNGTTFRDYYRNKLTNSDTEREDGRMYLGYAKAEIYDINKDFERRNKQKMHYCIPITHRCCSECENSFPKRIIYSQKSFAEERTDNYKVFLPGNYKDISGETGDITIVKYNGENAFVILTEEGMYQLPCTGQQKADNITQVVSFIGTGDYFVNDAMRVVYNDTNIGYGCKHKASFITTPYGSFWYSEHDNQVYGLIGGEKAPMPIFDAGMSRWFKRNGKLFMDSNYYDKYRIEYPYKDNPSSEVGTGYVMGWDNKYKRLLITKKDKYVPICESMCHFNAKAITYDECHVIDRVNELFANGKVNVCYKWSQEKCRWEIEYESIGNETNDSISIIEATVVHEHIFSKLVYIDPAGIVFYADEGCTREINMTSSLIDSLAGKLDGYTVVSNQDICDAIEITNRNITKYITEDDFETMIGLIASNENDIRTTLGIDESNYLFINYISNFDGFNGLSSKRNFFRNLDKIRCDYDNFNVKVIGIMPDANERICDTAESFFADIVADTEAIEDRVFVTEDISTSDHECPNYMNNFLNYLYQLQDILSGYKSMKDDFEFEMSEEYDISQFETLKELYQIYLTYTYFNTVSNSWDLTNSNGDKNLLAYYNANDTLKYELENYVTNGMCSDSADFTALKTRWQSEYIYDTIDSSYFAKTFKSLYKKMLESTHQPYYTHNTKIENICNIIEAFSRNRDSMYVQRDKKSVSDNEFIQVEQEINLPYGTTAFNCIGIDLTVYIKNIYDDSNIYNMDNSTLNSMSSYSGNSIVMTKSIDTRTNTDEHKYWTMEEETLDYNDDFKTLCELNENEALFNDMVQRFKEENPNYDGEFPEFDDTKGWVKECIDNCYVYSKDGYMMNYCANVIDNSFTISFDPANKRFLSFHSYLPNIYVPEADNFMTWIRGRNLLYRHNIHGNYLRFYDCHYPFVLELVNKASGMPLGPSIFESISLRAEADDVINGGLVDRRKVFFDYGYFYNSRQCTGFKCFDVKDDGYGNYFDDYLDSDGIPVERREKYWHINKIDDMVSKYGIPFHSEDIIDRRDFMDYNNMNGWIDKSLNENIFGVKDWWEIEPFKDMYICHRYFYDKPHLDSTFESVRFEIILNTVNDNTSIDNTLNMTGNEKKS